MNKQKRIAKAKVLLKRQRLSKKEIAAQLKPKDRDWETILTALSSVT